MSILNRPIPPNNVLDPKYDGWKISNHTYTFASQINEITIYDPNGPFDSFGPVLGVSKQVISLSNTEMKALSDAFDLKEIEYLQDKIQVIEKRLGIDNKWG